jgi:tetratricopeptide (TPR) repeat protein
VLVTLLLSFRLRLLGLFVIAALVFATSARSQQLQTNPVDVVINVFLDRMSNRAPQGLVVELQNVYGSNEAVLKTDSNGTTQAHTLAGSHRLRIYGSQIQEYQGSFEIEMIEVRHIENVVVHSKKDGATTSTSSNSGMVSAARLKIPEKALDEFKKGSKALTDKDWTGAKKYFDSAINIYPEYDVAYNGLGSALAGSGNMNDARPAFEKAISLNPNFAEAERNLARICFAEKKYDEALTLLDRSLSTDPLNAWALTSAANAALLTHHYDQAIAYARKAHSIPHPTSAGVHIVAALALEATQQPFEAIKEYQLYLDEDPKGRDAPRAQQAIQRLSAAK